MIHLSLVKEKKQLLLTMNAEAEIFNHMKTRYEKSILLHFTYRGFHVVKIGNTWFVKKQLLGGTQYFIKNPEKSWCPDSVIENITNWIDNYKTKNK